MIDDNEAAVTADFTDAVGLSALKAAGGRAAPSAPRSHGNAGSPAAPPPAASSLAAWPPPPTPDLFKQLVRHLDMLTCEITEMTSGVKMPREEEKYMDEVADQIWPLAHVYGAGADKPTRGVLITYALVALLGFASLKYGRFKTIKDGPRSPTLVE